MATIRIEWMTDASDCETCGTNWADGAIVYIDGAPAIDLEPAASCFGGDHYDAETVLREIIKRLGHTIEEG